MEQYVEAFQSVIAHVSDLQRKMLYAHYHAPERCLSAAQLAKAVGLANHSAANLHYGTLARCLCSVLGKQPGSDNLFILVSLIAPGERGNEHWLWVMRPQVAQALQQLGWTNDSAEALSALTPPFLEGATRRVSVDVYERNPEARARCIDHHGTSCTTCGFNFGDVYGEIGRDFIHVHHLTPLSANAQEHAVDPINDLRPVCANCHAMIHRQEPPLHIDDLKAMISANRNRSGTRK